MFQPNQTAIYAVGAVKCRRREGRHGPNIHLAAFPATDADDEEADA